MLMTTAQPEERYGVFFGEGEGRRGCFLIVTPLEICFLNQWENKNIFVKSSISLNILRLKENRS